MLRTLVAALVGGIAMFAWGAASHMLLPVWDEALPSVPERGEARLLEVLSRTFSEPGFYLYPGHDPDLDPSGPEYRAWVERAQQGPGGVVVYAPGGPAVMGARTMGIELASNVLAAFVVALALGVLQAGFFGRFFVATTFGVVGWLSISVSHWNWYSFPSAFLRAELTDQLGGWLCCGLVLAAIVRTREDPRR